MTRRLTLMAALLAAISVGPALADWLVLRQGGALETRGEWEIKGKLIVFHRADGSLASMRLDEVDLEASRKRTEAAKAPKPKPKPAPKPKPEKVTPVLVLTDADVAHIDPATLKKRTDEEDEEAFEEASGDAEGGEATETAAPEEEVPEALQVTGWERLDDYEFLGIKLGGTIQNDSEEIAIDIGLTARLLDDAGRTIGRAQATLGTTALAPGESTRFEVGFSGVYGYDSVEFAPRSFNAVRQRDGDD